MNPLERYPIPHNQVAGRIIDDEAVIVLSESGEVEVLNAVGARIWELADGSRSLAQIIEQIVREFDVSLEQATTDVVEFVGVLEREKVVVLGDGPV